MIDFTLPLAFEDGTPIDKAEPWHYGEHTGWMVFAKATPEPWHPNCTSPTRGLVVLEDGTVFQFPSLPKVVNVPRITPRRPLGVGDYLESDRDFVLNNLEACVAYLESKTT